MRSIYEDRYRIFYHDPADKFTCFYCGEPASTLDHCPPLSRVSDYDALNLLHPAFVKVPACEECNAVLGAYLSIDPIDREMELKRCLEQRYARLLAVEEWTPEQIRRAGLVGRLRGDVEAFQKRQQWILRRIDYGAGVNAYLEAFGERLTEES